MKRLLTLAAFLVATLTLHSGAEESLDDICARLNVRADAWEGFEPGSWIETKETYTAGGQPGVIEERLTLAKRDKDGTRFDRRNIQRKKGSDGKDIVEFGKLEFLAFPPASIWQYRDLKDLREEDLVVNGRKIPCRVIGATYAKHLIRFGRPRESEDTWATTLWWSPTVEGGLVKLESEPSTDPLEQGSWALDLVDPSRPALIGGRSFRCWVYRASPEEERWMCAQVPGGVVRTIRRGKAASAIDWDWVLDTEVTAFEAKRSDWLKAALELPAPVPGASLSPEDTDAVENALRILAERARRRRLSPDPDAPVVVEGRREFKSHPELSASLALLASREVVQRFTDEQARLAAALAVDGLTDVLVIADRTARDGPITLVLNECPPILEALTGTSLGSIPFGGVMQAPDPEGKSAAEGERTIKSWRRWWGKAGSGPRDQWLALAGEVKKEIDAEPADPEVPDGTPRR